VKRALQSRRERPVTFGCCGSAASQAGSARGVVRPLTRTQSHTARRTACGLYTSSANTRSRPQEFFCAMCFLAPRPCGGSGEAPCV